VQNPLLPFLKPHEYPQEETKYGEVVNTPSSIRRPDTSFIHQADEKKLLQIKCLNDMMLGRI
jgi:hypothetical protein